MKIYYPSRREFLKKTAVAAAGAAILPTILPSCAKGANDRINVAHIGVGGRGAGVAKSYFLPVPDSRSLATCDAFADRRNDLAGQITSYYRETYNENTVCTPYADFQEILERADIDAVHIATADHWHLPIAIKAARAGKHIYCEKPLGINLSNMIELEKIMKEKNLVFQYGTQQRSLTHIRKGIEMIRSGQIGDLQKVEIWAPAGEIQLQGSADPTDPPAGLDYDRWLGPAQVKPYSAARVAPTGIYYIYDYAIGFIAGWGAHPLDVAIWGAAEQMSDVGTFTGSGTIFPEDIIFDTVDTWNIEIRYNNGLYVHFVSSNHADAMKEGKSPHGDGTTFFGSKGWISLSRGSAASDIPGLHEELNKEVYGENNRHGLNFIRSIKGEIEPFNPLDESILSDCISHMGNILIRSGMEQIVWDPKKRQIVNYPGLTDVYFHRELRAPYNV
jgi:hypothetical protein